MGDYTHTQELVAEPSVATSGINSIREQMFNNFCHVMERESMDYVILSGYQGYPTIIDSDVDFMVSEYDFARLPDIFRQDNCIPGARLVQALQHETSACYYVFTQQIGQRIAFLHPDAAASYRRGGRLWLRSQTVLASRRKSPLGFWIPSPDVEFEYYLIKRIDKALLESRHVQALAQLMAEEPQGCLAVLVRHFHQTLANEMEVAIRQTDTQWFVSNRTKLRVALAKSIPSESNAARAYGKVKNLMRATQRVLQPTGLVIAVLGPDGSGKTTVIEHLEAEMAPAFRRTKRFHLRPHFGKAGGSGAPVTDPHAPSSRGIVPSVLKTMLFIADYWVGWLKLVYPAKVRSTLVVFDRYYHDMLIDPVRYRLPYGFTLPKLLAGLVPQPDLWLILDAPPATLVARKGEITLQAAQELTVKYRALANTLPHATLINTGQGLPETLAKVVGTVNYHLGQRMQARVNGGAQ